MNVIDLNSTRKQSRLETDPYPEATISIDWNVYVNWVIVEQMHR